MRAPEVPAHRIPLSLVLSVLSLVSAMVLAVGPAVAAPPERLADELTDHVGALSDPAAVTEVQDRLAREKGLQLFVVVVDDFDGREPEQWLARTAALSQLGEQDMAAAFAADTRELAVQVPRGTHLVRREVDRVEEQARATLADGDIEVAVRELVTGLDQATQRDGSAIASRALWIGGAALVLLALASWITWSVTSRARRRRQEVADTARAGELAREHGALAVRLDEALEEAEMEVDFARAEFDPPRIASMTETMQQARQQAVQAYRRREEVVTGPVDDPRWQVPPDRARTGMEQVVGLTRAGLERVETIPRLLAELRRQSDLVPTRIEGLRELGGGTQVPETVRAQVEPLLARAASDVAQGRPEAALIPLQTVVALLEGALHPPVSGSGNAAGSPPDPGAPGR